jgi:flagellar protein FliS
MVGYKKNSAVSKYRQGSSSEVEYAPPHRLVQMLMEGALDRIAAAKGDIERKDIEARSGQITWAISIVDGLRASLNLEVGGEIAANLDRLYEYMIRRLGEANAHNDIVPLDEVASLLKELKGAWDAMPENIRSARSIEEIAEIAASEGR